MNSMIPPFWPFRLEIPHNFSLLFRNKPLLYSYLSTPISDIGKKQVGIQSLYQSYYQNIFIKLKLYTRISSEYVYGGMCMRVSCVWCCCWARWD